MTRYDMLSYVPNQVFVREIIGSNIDRGIVRTGLTNREIANLINHELGDGKIDGPAVWRWRRGKHMPGPQMLGALAAVLFDGDFTQLYAPSRNGRATKGAA